MHKETRVCRQRPAHTLLLSPDSTRGREISLKFSHLSWITLNPFNSLLPLVPGNNLKVSHSWPAPPGSLPSDIQMWASKAFSTMKMPRRSRTCTVLLHFRGIESTSGGCWPASPPRQPQNMHVRGRPRGTRVQAAQEGRQTDSLAQSAWQWTDWGSTRHLQNGVTSPFH